MNRIRSFLVGLAFGAMGIGAAVALPITGAQDPATFIRSLNQYVLNWMTYVDNGEVQLLGSNAFTGLGTTATAMSSVGPTGSSTTVQRWMIVVNPAGTVGYVPVF